MHTGKCSPNKLKLVFRNHIKSANKSDNPMFSGMLEKLYMYSDMFWILLWLILIGFAVEGKRSLNPKCQEKITLN